MRKKFHHPVRNFLFRYEPYYKRSYPREYKYCPLSVKPPKYKFLKMFRGFYVSYIYINVYGECQYEKHYHGSERCFYPFFFDNYPRDDTLEHYR